MINIHLRRTGARRDAHYRVVVADSSAARDGAFIEILGHYHPRYEPAKVELDVDKVKEWIAKGAKPSDTVKSLLRKVESGAVETAAPRAPSRQRDAAKHAEIRAAAPAPAAEADEAEPAPEAAEADAAPEAADSGDDAAEATDDVPAEAAEAPAEAADGAPAEEEATADDSADGSGDAAADDGGDDSGDDEDKA